MNIKNRERRVFSSKKEKEEYQTWFSNLLPESRVAVVVKKGIPQPNVWTSPVKILTVNKVLPTGKVKLSDGSHWNNYGMGYNHHAAEGLLGPITEHVQYLIEKYELIERLKPTTQEEHRALISMELEQLQILEGLKKYIPN